MTPPIKRVATEGQTIGGPDSTRGVESLGLKPPLTQMLIWSLHSFIFAAIPNVVFLTANLRLLPVTISDAARSALWLIAANGVLLVFVSAIRGIRAGAVTLSCFYIALSFFASASTLREAISPGWPLPLWAALYCMTCVSIALIVGRAPRRDDTRYRMLNAVAIAVVISCGVISLYESTPVARTRWERVVAAIAGDAPAPPLGTSARRPDIYYIVLDGMGRSDVLQSAYGVESRVQVEQLERFGWRVLSRSRANYAQTYTSLAATLTGSYLSALSDVMGPTADRRPLFELIQQSGTVAGLKRIGYRFVLIGSTTSVTRSHRLADVCLCDRPGLTEFENGLLTMTPFAAVPIRQSTYYAHYRTVVDAFEAIRQVREPRQPQLLIAHIMVPHPPFVVDRIGRFVNHTGPVLLRDGDHFSGSAADYREGYREQAMFALGQLVELARWINDQTREAIVLVHGDHGPGASYSHSRPSAEGISERFPVFLGVRLTKSAEPPADLSPVNLFRFMLNTEFGTAFPLLPNRSYYATWDAPYSFVDVTMLDETVPDTRE